MAKVKVEVVGAYVDGKGPGETLSIEERSAELFEKLGHVKRVEDAKPEPKPKSKPKAKTSKKADENDGEDK